MAIVLDPDDLDRWQVLVDPVAETVSIRGLGTLRHAADATGDSDGTTTFTDAGANFTTDGVVAGDILTIISDPSNNGLIIGHYEVVTVGTTTLTVDRAIPASTSANLDYRINAGKAKGGTPANVSDGVTLQAVYSFLKEEWKTKDGSLPSGAQDLIKYPFAFTPITREQFIMGSGATGKASAWTWAEGFALSANTVASGTTTQLIRTGGWQEVDDVGATQREWTGVVTLGSLDTDAQVYYQQHAAAATPVNFVNLGAVNQAVKTLDFNVGPGASLAITANNTITRGTGSFVTDGYVTGGRVTIRNAEDGGNNGTFVIASVSALVLTVTGTPLTNNADDDTMELATDRRLYLKLFVRKKGRTYASSQISDIGVTSIETLVNRFPLSHVADPAITFDDGQMAGDGTNTVFQAVETHSTDTDGVVADLGNGSFTFSSATVTPAFNATARGGVQILQPGDTLQISSGIAGEQGFYVIKSVDSATQITCFDEPTKGAMSSQSSLTFTVRTRTRDVGAANATLANVSGATGTLTSAGSTFDVDTALGDRTVVAGDMVLVTAGTGAVIGAYKVISVDSATVLTLNTSDQIFGGQTSQTYRIVRAGMYLQRFETLAGDHTAASVAFVNSNPDTITRGAGSFITDGYTAGMALTVTLAEDPTNNQTFIIATVGALTITLIAEEVVTANADDTAAVFAGDTGVVRTINAVVYPFHWRLFANGGTLSQVFQWLQWQLRLQTDIDAGNGVARGDITNLLMTFASPNGVTLDLFPDNLSATELNNVTYTDLSGDARNNAFLAGITINVPQTLIDAGAKKLVVFFTNPTGGAGDEFGTPGAIIVLDKDAVAMQTTVIAASPVTFVFDYTNNAQGGRTPDTDADITIVAIGDTEAQYDLAQGTVLKQNNNVFSVANPIERVYSNP